MLIKAAVTSGKGEPFQIDTIRIDDPKPGEVQVRIVAAGICHTDLIVRNQHQAAQDSETGVTIKPMVKLG